MKTRVFSVLTQILCMLTLMGCPGPQKHIEVGKSSTRPDTSSNALLNDHDKKGTSGLRIYQTECESCHRVNLRSTQSTDHVPDLTGIVARRSTEEIIHAIKFDHDERYEFESMSNSRINAVVNYIINEPFVSE